MTMIATVCAPQVSIYKQMKMERRDAWSNANPTISTLQTGPHVYVLNNSSADPIRSREENVDVLAEKENMK